MTTVTNTSHTPDYVTVSEFTAEVREILNGTFDRVWIRGEVSGFQQARSGHCYFTLKDESAQLSAIIWKSQAARLKFLPEDGDDVICQGYIDVYPARGTYQLIVRRLQPVGQGDLQLAFQRLFQKLKSEGLFDAESKRPLPEIPRRVAVVTSPTGAAIEDFLRVIRRRWPGLQVTIIPTPVQGPGAAERIANAIGLVSELPVGTFDVLVVTRGGGSIEDLWCFNEEIVCRALFECPLPTVSAIGHEIDTTLCDFVVDLRALTPTEAAERIVPDRETIRAELGELAGRLVRRIQDGIRIRQERLAGLVGRTVLARPLDLVRFRAEQLDRLAIALTDAIDHQLGFQRQQLVRFGAILRTSFFQLLPRTRFLLEQISARPGLSEPLRLVHDRRTETELLGRRLRSAIAGQWEAARRQVDGAAMRMQAYDPRAVLQRGYSLTLDEAGRPIVSCQQVGPGDTIRTRLADGTLVSRVEPPPSEESNGQKDQDF